MIRLALFCGVFAPFFLLMAIAESGLTPVVIGLAIFTSGLVAGVALGRWSMPPDADPHFHNN